MAKKNPTTYFPTKEDVIYSLFCHDMDLAICIHQIPNQGGWFWVEKHLISVPNKYTFLREDLTQKDSVSNRKKFNEYDAVRTVFELYEQVYKSKNKV